MEKYFYFKGTISGTRYFLRIFLQSYLIGFFGLGFYLLFVTGYKRASALTDNKLIRILFSLNTLILSVLSFAWAFTLGMEDNDYSVFFEDTISIFFTLLFVLSISAHWYLILKNSNINEHNG
jgi:hypothetical protein